jgi:hypothetical protein
MVTVALEIISIYPFAELDEARNSKSWRLKAKGSCKQGSHVW